MYIYIYPSTSVFVFVCVGECICIYLYIIIYLNMQTYSTIHKPNHKPCACSGDRSEASDFPTSAASSHSKREMGERL